MAIIRHRAIILIALVVLILLLAMSCRECPTEQPDYDIYLSAEDVFSTSVVLNVTLPDSGDVSAFSLTRDDSTVATYTCFDDDTLIVDEDLTPNTDYIYRVHFLKDGKTRSESNSVTVHTMDTTSHDFTWEIDTLGNYGSYLKDAWIVDEKNIWVVGYIRVDDPDSSFDGTGKETFNAARWDGEKWNLMCIVNSDPKFGIYYFDENDIWIISYGYPVHYDGSSWTLYRFHDMEINASALALWGTSSSNMYFVGLNGSIVHYNGTTFTKMESGTEIDLNDVDGLDDRVVAVGYNSDGTYAGQSIAVYGYNDNWTTIGREYSFYPEDSTDRGKINSVWAYDDKFYYIDNCGLIRYDPQNGESREWFTKGEMNISHLNIVKMRGNALNDIIHVNNWAHIIHYNGQDWLPIEDIFNQYPNGGIDVEGLDFKGDIVTIVGFMRAYSHAVVIRGQR